MVWRVSGGDAVGFFDVPTGDVLRTFAGGGARPGLRQQLKVSGLGFTSSRYETRRMVVAQPERF